MVRDGAQRAAQPAATTPAATGTVTLCVGVAPLQPSTAPGQPAQWAVGAWAVGGNVPNVTLQLQAAPASAGTPQFSFGCATNGTATCALGTVDAGSAQRQLQAQLTVPLTGSVTSVSLAVTGSATGLTTSPQAAAVVNILGSAGATPSLPTGLPTGLLSGGTTASPGGNAGGLFPSVTPYSGSPSTSQVANTSPLSPSGHLIVQLAGLAALFAAFLLAVTRVSIRRPRAVTPGGAGASPPGGTDEPTRELGDAEDSARRSRGAESAKRLKTLTARGHRTQGRSGARHRRT